MSGVTIVGSVADVAGVDQYEFEGKFTGTFVPTVVPANGLFISGNKFYYSKGTTNIQGLRGWFELSVVLNQAIEVEAPVYIDIDGVATGVEVIDNGQWTMASGTTCRDVRSSIVSRQMANCPGAFIL